MDTEHGGFVLGLTAKDGGEATLVGDIRVIEAVQAALKRDGWFYHVDTDTVDQGYYEETQKKQQQAKIAKMAPAFWAKEGK